MNCFGSVHVEHGGALFIDINKDECPCSSALFIDINKYECPCSSALFIDINKDGCPCSSALFIDINKYGVAIWCITVVCSLCNNCIIPAKFIQILPHPLCYGTLFDALLQK